MKILNATSQPLLSNLQASSSNVQNLRSLVGQTWPIQITQTTGQQVSFTLNDRTYHAQSTVLLKPGDHFQVKISEHQGQLRLTISPQSNSTDTLQSFYRQLLPSQTPIQQTLQLLQQTALPSSLQSQIQSLLDQVLRPTTTLDAKRVKQAIEQSGTFLENNLQKKKPDIQQDLKAQLFKLQQSFDTLNRTQNTPNLTQALTLIKQSINKISLNQLHQLEQDQTIYTHIPLNQDHTIEAVQLEVHQVKNTRGIDWEVMLTMTLNQPEDLICKLTLTDQDAFHCLFYAEDTQLAEHITNQLPILNESFQQAGLALNLLQVSQQKPRFSSNTSKMGLIDIKI